MNLPILFSVTVILVLLKVIQLNHLAKEGNANNQSSDHFSSSMKKVSTNLQNNTMDENIEYYKEDRDNIQLTSSDDAYKPDFKPIQIDTETQGSGSDLDPEVCVYEQGRKKVNEIYGVSPYRSGHTDKDDLLYLYDKLSGPVDLGMANVMSATSKKSKQALTNRSRMTRNTFADYFRDELDGHENRRWWDNDELEIAM